MAYDQALAARVQGHLAAVGGLGVLSMFGGLGFTVNGNMFAGVLPFTMGNGLVVRVGPQQYAAALARPGVQPFGPAGRVLRGWVRVEPQALAAEGDLRDWLHRGLQFAATLPPKAASRG